MAYIVKVVPQGDDIYLIEDRKHRWDEYQCYRLEDGYGTTYPFSLVWHWTSGWRTPERDTYMHAERENGHWVLLAGVSFPGPKHKW